MIKAFFKNTILFALVAALGVASLPIFSVSAAGSDDPTQGQKTYERLERVWARELRFYNRLGKLDQVIDRVQKLIDRAEANGKDASGVQSALDAFKAAWKDAHPTYESMKGTINSHQGFDAN